MKKVLRVLATRSCAIQQTGSGVWLPTDAPVNPEATERELLVRSVTVFGCTVNGFTIDKLVRSGYLAPTEDPQMFILTLAGRRAGTAPRSADLDAPEPLPKETDPS
jgi:hypothetical protein